MASKETFTQHLAHEVVQAVVHRERYGLPPTIHRQQALSAA